MISQASRKHKIVLCVTGMGLLVLSAVVASQIMNWNLDGEIAPPAVPARVNDISERSVDSASSLSSPDESSKAPDESSAAQIRIEDLKRKLKADQTDFGRMKRDLEDRLSKAPDGKISPDDVLAVIPPQYREEFKSVVAGMYAPSDKPTTIKETRP